MMLTAKRRAGFFRATGLAIALSVGPLAACLSGCMEVETRAFVAARAYDQTRMVVLADQGLTSYDLLVRNLKTNAETWDGLNSLPWYYQGRYAARQVIKQRAIDSRIILMKADGGGITPLELAMEARANARAYRDLDRAVNGGNASFPLDREPVNPPVPQALPTTQPDSVSLGPPKVLWAGVVGGETVEVIGEQP